MSFRFPERPVLFYPSLAREIGPDEALLLALYHERIESFGQLDKVGNRAMVLARHEWLALADFWDEEHLAVITNSLVSQGMILAAFGQGGAIKVSFPAEQTEVNAFEPIDEPPEYLTQEETETVTVQQLPVVEQPPERSEISRRVQQAQSRRPGPAPTFGGSIGWSRSRHTSVDSNFSARLNEIEEKNQKLHNMFLGWKPSQMLFDLLPRHSIPAEFADSLLDEFVLYWLDKDRKESNWDQKFLAWVKREWVNKQTRDARQKRAEQDTNIGVNHENTRTDTREKRKRVTAAIMDIKDTDW